jgi:hypothetical protein
MRVEHIHGHESTHTSAALHHGPFHQLVAWGSPRESREDTMTETSTES